MSRRNRRHQRPREPRELEIESLSHEGRGIARINGKTVFVSAALPGERVLARIVRGRRKFDEATTVEVLQASPARIVPRCAAFAVCGGCSLQHLSAGDQLAHKQQTLLAMMAHAGIEIGALLPPLVGETWGYRQKARLGVKYVDGKGRALVGFRERDTPFIADMHRCEVLLPQVGHQLEALSALIGGLEARRSIPQIEVAADDTRVQLVFRHLQPLSSADRERLVEFAKATGFYLQLQPGGPGTVHDLHPQGQSLAYDPLGDGRLRIEFKATDFVQVNAGINRQMVAQALDLLELSPEHRALDLFCGLGNFTLPMALRCGRVTGVEGDEAMVGRARDAARANGIDNAEFAVGDLSRADPGLPWMRQRYERILLDPPRSGAPEMAAQVAALGAGRIVYLSCQPSSLVRDAAIICAQGYRLSRLGIMDMFPQTSHVESMAVFERQPGAER